MNKPLNIKNGNIGDTSKKLLKGTVISLRKFKICKKNLYNFKRNFGRKAHCITRVLVCFSLIVLLNFALLPIAVAEEAVIGDDTITSKAAIVMDYETGIVIFEYNADEQRVPASMVKMVAAHVVFDAVRDGIISLDTMVEISESTSEFSLNRRYSNVPLSYESTYSVSSLLDVVIVRSAGAATIALGEAIFGSEEAFVEQMNLKAEELNIPATFHDSWGGSPDNRISARGMAEMTRALITEHPEILYFTSQVNVSFNEIEYTNTNQLLADVYGVDGFKTGFTTPAGWCFSGTAVRYGRRIITITMGSEQGYRFSDSITLLYYGFENFEVGVANHFRRAARPPAHEHVVHTGLVPIQMYNIDTAQYFDILDLAILLNEN